MNDTRHGRIFLGLGFLIALLAVAAGAFGAHGLRGRLDPASLAVFETAARYQFYHAFGLILAGLLHRLCHWRKALAAGWLFLAGLVLFSGSLYGLTLSGVRWFGAITPLGGVAFMAGWGVLAWSAFFESAR